jgi:hypothetical protein
MAILGRLNKPAKSGYKYRSPNQTNAEDLTPNLREDVGASQRADFDRFKKGITNDSKNPANRKRSQDAAKRAASRTLGRASGLAGAGIAGYELGKAIDEKTGAGKQIVEKSGVGPAIDRYVKSKHEGVKFSESAKKRIESGELDEEPKKAKESEGSEAPKKANKPAVKKKPASFKEPQSTIREGRNENISESDRIAGETSVDIEGMKKGGKVAKYAKGGSVRGYGISKVTNKTKYV